jgi:DNA-binding NarL/FixJ family response regulator
LIRVAIVAPSLPMRLGLRELLQRVPDVHVGAEAASAAGLPPADVLVLTSAASLAELGQDSPPILLLADESEPAHALTRVPVWGLLPQEASPEELSAAIHALAEGLFVGAPGLLGRLYKQPGRPLEETNEAAPEPLTERERQVLQLAAEGLANKQIAAALQISEHTVKFHLSSLYGKLGVASRTEAIRAGTRRGWVAL